MYLLSTKRRSSYGMYMYAMISALVPPPRLGLTEPSRVLRVYVHRRTDRPVAKRVGRRATRRPSLRTRLRPPKPHAIARQYRIDLALGGHVKHSVVWGSLSVDTAQATPPRRPSINQKKEKDMHAVLLVPMSSTSWNPPLFTSPSAALSMTADSHGAGSRSNDVNLRPGAQVLLAPLAALLCASIGSHPSTASTETMIDPDMIFLDYLSPLSGSLNVPLGGVHPADVYVPSLAPFTDMPSMFALGQPVNSDALSVIIFVLLAVLSDLAAASVGPSAALPLPNVSNHDVLREQAFTSLLAEKAFLPSLAELSDSCFCIAEDEAQPG